MRAYGASGGLIPFRIDLCALVRLLIDPFCGVTLGALAVYLLMPERPAGWGVCLWSLELFLFFFSINIQNLVLLSIVIGDLKRG